MPSELCTVVANACGGVHGPLSDVSDAILQLGSSAAGNADVLLAGIAGLEMFDFSWYNSNADFDVDSFPVG